MGTTTFNNSNFDQLKSSNTPTCGEKDAVRSIKCLPLKKTEQWKRIKILFIDKTSMLDSNYFEQLNEVVKKVRESNKVFGAVQLIVCGDFFQLPPVSGKIVS